jgi:hypothetical protein
LASCSGDHGTQVQVLVNGCCGEVFAVNIDTADPQVKVKMLCDSRREQQCLMARRPPHFQCWRHTSDKAPQAWSQRFLCNCSATLSFPATRSHKDLAKDAAPHFRKAKKFYDVLATEMVGHGHICDIFSCALDNVSDTVQANERWDAVLASPLSYILIFSSICSDRN